MSKNKNTEQRYVVAPGVSFVGKKRAYVAGDPIDESAFSKPEHFKKFLSCNPPKIVPPPPEAEKDPEKKSGKKNETGENLDRKALEEKAFSLGLTVAELAGLTDTELAELLEKNEAE
jgi:hypothetical protein